MYSYSRSGKDGEEMLATGKHSVKNQLRSRPNLCLMWPLITTDFQFSESFYRQKHSWAMGSPVFPIVASIYVEVVESRALINFIGPAPSHLFRYVDDTWVKTQTREVEAYTHINAVDSNIKFSWDDVRGDSFPFLDCAVHIEEDRSLNTEVYRKPTHTDQYLFDSHHPLEHKVGFLRILNHHTYKESRGGEGTKAYQGSAKNLWRPKLDLCHNFQKIQSWERREERKI